MSYTVYPPVTILQRSGFTATMTMSSSLGSIPTAVDSRDTALCQDDQKLHQALICESTMHLHGRFIPTEGIGYSCTHPHTANPHAPLPQVYIDAPPPPTLFILMNGYRGETARAWRQVTKNAYWPSSLM